MKISLFGKTALLFGLIGVLLSFGSLQGQQPAREQELHVDSDQDGLNDALEQQLLEQFAPKFMMGQQDCSISPAEFVPQVQRPEVKAENGTIYAQVFPSKHATDHAITAEIHYYHLWRKDCGGHGHPLDTEHVAVLIRASNANLAEATWKAVLLVRRSPREYCL